MESQAAARWQSRRHAAAVTEQLRAEGRWRTGRGEPAGGQTWLDGRLNGMQDSQRQSGSKKVDGEEDGRESNSSREGRQKNKRDDEEGSRHRRGEKKNISRAGGKRRQEHKKGMEDKKRGKRRRKT